MTIRLQLLLGLLADAVRWHLHSHTLGYRLRPYCWLRDDRHVWWRHRRCRCAPPIYFDITVDTTELDRALERLLRPTPQRRPR